MVKKEHVPWLLLLLVLLGLTVRHEWRKRNPPEPTPQQKAYVQIVPEIALFDNMNVRVVVAARLLPSAPISEIDFVHIRGYFLDQTGTSYTPGLSRVNNRALPTDEDIEPWEKHQLKPGEIYRYCLGPASIDVDQSSEQAAASAITKIQVYLDGLRPTNVPVRRWRRLDPTSDNPSDYR